MRLGIVAPPNIAVDRREVYEQIQRENKVVSRTPASTAGPTLNEIRDERKTLATEENNLH